MKRLKQNLTIVAIAIVAFVSFITGIALLTDAISAIPENKKQSVTDLQTQNDEDIVSNIQRSVNPMPDNIRAASVSFLYYNNISSGKNGEEILGSVRSEIETWQQCYVNTFIYNTTADTQPYAVTDSDGNKLDLLRFAFDETPYAFHVLAVNVSDYDSVNSAQDFIATILEKYAFDGLLLHTAESGNSNISEITSIISYFSSKYTNFFFGIECSSLTALNDFSAIQNVDFAIVSSQNDKNLPDSHIPVLFRLTISSDNISDMLSEIYANPISSGVVFSENSNHTISQDCVLTIASFFYHTQSDMLLTDLILSPDASSLQLRGTTSKSVVFCNRQIISCSNGQFTSDIQLNPGRNSFVLRDSNKIVYGYIFKNYRLIYAAFPCDTDYVIPDGESLTCYAECLQGATVTCTFCDRNFNMTEISSDAIGISVHTGYQLFSCSFDFSEKNKEANLGSLVISAEKNGSRQTITTCSQITIQTDIDLSATETVKLTEVTESDSSFIYKKEQNGYELSPFTDNQLGKAVMCRIIKDNAEQITTAATDTFQPTKSAIPEGSIDYIENIAHSDYGFVRYDLKSGISVLADTAEIIADGYVLPENNIEYVNTETTDVTKTIIRIHTDWPVPITGTVGPQNYFTGYQNYAFNIEEFTAEYIDLKFFYTTKAFNLNGIQFPDNCEVKTSESIFDDDGYVILRLRFRNKGVFNGYTIRHDEENSTIIIEIKNNVQSLSGKYILLDPGHGGYFMTGATDSTDTIAEKQITLEVAEKIKLLLESYGATVKLTRKTDIPLELEERLAICNQENPDIFVSLHCDGAESQEESGTHSFYYTPFSMPLAECIHQSIVSTYQKQFYEAGSQLFENADNGIKYFPFAMIRTYCCPAVLVEMGFLTNPTEGKILSDNDSQNYLARAIAEGIATYVLQY